MCFAISLLTQGINTLDVKVESTVDKKVNFAALHTYRWVSGFNSANKTTDAMIVSAIDKEMAKVGLTPVTTGGDVTLAYHGVASTYVDVATMEQMEKEKKTGPTPMNTVGRLVVVMRRPPSTDPIWSASTREYVDPDPAKLADTIQKVTARLFDTYPTKAPAPAKSK
jgi:hypothetical protein